MDRQPHHFPPSTKVSKSKDRDWANLPNDLLCTISCNLLVPMDYLAFGEVCSTWRAARTPTLPPKKPFLLFFDTLESVHMFIGVSNLDDVSYNYFSNAYLHGTFCVGSQDGWFITVTIDAAVALYKPFTNQLLKFPSLSTVLNFKGALSYKRSFDIILGTVIVWPSQKHEECILVATLNQWPHLIFARPSDDGWYYKSETGHGMYKYLCCVDNTVFASQNGVDMHRVQLNKSSASRIEARSDHTSVKEFSACRIETCSDRTLVKESTYTSILNLGKDIVRVRACLDNAIKGINIVIVEKLDLEKKFWVPLADLGGYSLFLGRWCSTARQATELPKNRIYFDLHSYGKWLGIGVFNMEDGSYKRHNIPYHQSVGNLSVWYFAPCLTMVKGLGDLQQSLSMKTLTLFS